MPSNWGLNDVPEHVCATRSAPATWPMPPHTQARAGARGAAAHATGTGAWGREPALEVARCRAPTATEAVGGAGAAAWSQIACHDGGEKGIHCQHGYPSPQSRVQGHFEPGASLDHARHPGAACLALAYHRSPTGNTSQKSALQYFDIANCVVCWLWEFLPPARHFRDCHEEGLPQAWCHALALPP